jgi:hypothetical protein
MGKSLNGIDAAPKDGYIGEGDILTIKYFEQEELSQSVSYYKTNAALPLYKSLCLD